MRKIIIYVLLPVTVTAIAIACTSGNSPEDQLVVASINSIQPSQDSMIRRGKYLVTVMGCNDCHTPMKMTPQGPMPDEARLLSGYPAEVPLPAFDKKTAAAWALFSLSGSAMKGPWGTTFAANLTSDETGIGNWTEAQFFTAIRKGLYKGTEGSRPLLPPMPWQNYAQASDEDLKAVFAYLKSTVPVNNRVPAPLPPGK